MRQPMTPLETFSDEAKIAYETLCTHGGRCLPCLEKVVRAACAGAIREEMAVTRSVREWCAGVADRYAGTRTDASVIANEIRNGPRAYS